MGVLLMYIEFVGRLYGISYGIFLLVLFRDKFFGGGVLCFWLI